MLKKFLAIVLCFVWMGVIFYNSSNTGVVSNNKSYEIEVYLKKQYNLLKNLLQPLIRGYGINVSSTAKYEMQHKENNNISLSNNVDKVKNTLFHSKGEQSFSNNDNRINLIIRKNAHAFEYLILALFISYLFFNFNFKGRKAIIYILFICLFYAVTDEFHQIFVPGRTSSVVDVLIDFLGSIVGIIIFYVVYYAVKLESDEGSTLPDS